MKLTTRSEYALLAMIYLVRNSTEERITAERIAREQDIPRRYLDQILLTLRRANYVHSVQGQRGGFRLARQPAEISLAEIIRLFDGALAPTVSASEYYYGATPIEKEEQLLKVFRAIRDHIAHQMENTTLADVS
jgi:Rrf2 family protein